MQPAVKFRASSTYMDLAYGKISSFGVADDAGFRFVGCGVQRNVAFGGRCIVAG